MDVQVVGKRAAKIYATIHGDAEFQRLERSTKLYTDCWATFSGYPIICEYNQVTDTPPLFREGLRLLSLKAAVWQLTNGDEKVSELLAPLPVDEMVHAILAQTNLVLRLIDRHGIPFVHMTDTEEFAYETGCFTDQCYVAAGWGEPNRRYWIGGTEARRRLNILDTAYQKIGIGGFGRHHSLTFEESKELVAA